MDFASRTKFLSRIDSELEQMLDEGEELLSLGEYTHPGVLRGGKLIRSRLVLTCAAHFPVPDWRKVRLAALAIELVHNGTLYHDDIVDRSESRRGAPSMYCQRGIRGAAMGGAQLISLGSLLISYLPPEIWGKWSTAARLMASGQMQDTEAAGYYGRTPKQYLKNARRKTGIVFELAAYFGGTLGGASIRDTDHLISFARHLGIAFQILDDLNDFVTNPANDRTPANDLRERTYTLPVLIGCRQPGAIGDRLREILADDGRPTSAEVIGETITLLGELSAFRKAGAYLSTELEKARGYLGRLRSSAATDALKELTESLITEPDYEILEAASVP